MGMIKMSEKKSHDLLLQPVTKGLSSYNPHLSVSLTIVDARGDDITSISIASTKYHNPKSS